MIKRIYLKNVGPFRGEHALDLGPGAYAVTARHERDRSRSVGLGKSMLAEAIHFAITGSWPRRRLLDGIDGWITRGEREGAVMLMLEDGSAIERTKIVGKPNQARAKTPGTGWKEAYQDEATRALLKHLCFDAAGELADTCYVRQKRADAFLLADPADRLAIVSGWLGLAAAGRAEKLAGEHAGQLDAKVEAAIAKRDLLAARAKDSVAEDPNVEIAIDMLRERIAGVAARRKIARENAKHREVVAMQDERIARGKKLAAEDHKAPGVEVFEEYRLRVENAKTAFDEATREARQKAQVAAGRFDGRCPVAGIDCPATDAINADRIASAKTAQKAREARDAAEKVFIAADAAWRPLEKAHHEEAAHERLLERLRAEVRAHAAEAKEAWGKLAAAPVIDEEKDDIEEQTARSDLDLLVGEKHRRDATNAQATKALEELGGAVEEVERLLAKQRSLMAARACIRAAQRRVAERALVDIERGANAALEEAGVDLRLAARWEREGKEPAKQCEECGAAFPTSRKVKECARCGAARGVHVVQRLDLVQEDSSGGLDDLAGVAWQHSAGAWLLRARQSPWSTAILDEPTAALDAPSRRGLVRYLTATIRRGEFRQLLICSHASDTLDAVGRKIVVVCGEDGSRRLSLE